MGEPQTPHFYDFEIFGRVPSSQTQFFLFLETPGQLNKLDKCFIKQLVWESFVFED